jgi:dynactin 1
LGYALSFDHDLDMFAASLGLVKTSIEDVMNEDGIVDINCYCRLLKLLLDIVLEMGDFDPAESLFDPLQRVLDQCRSGKNPSKWVFLLPDSISMLNTF